MKAIIFILGVMFITNSNAQKFDCPSKMKEYQELFKAKKIAESAYERFRIVQDNNFESDFDREILNKLIKK